MNTPQTKFYVNKTASICHDFKKGHGVSELSEYTVGIIGGVALLIFIAAVWSIAWVYS